MIKVISVILALTAIYFFYRSTNDSGLPPLACHPFNQYQKETADIFLKEYLARAQYVHPELQQEMKDNYTFIQQYSTSDTFDTFIRNQKKLVQNMPIGSNFRVEAPEVSFCSAGQVDIRYDLVLSLDTSEVRRERRKMRLQFGSTLQDIGGLYGTDLRPTLRVTEFWISPADQ